MAASGRPDDPPDSADGATPEDVFAAALAGGGDVAEAARAVGWSPRTGFRRLSDAAARARVAELRCQAVAKALGRLTDAMSAAADRLRCLLNSDDERVQLAASRAVLEFGQKITETVELEQRLAALEAERHR
jgi:hypothetical protein